MRWFFSRKPPHPLDEGDLRGLAGRIALGELRAAAADLKEARTRLGETPAVVYLEALLYHEGAAVGPEDLLGHLGPALAPALGTRFPEARLLAAELKAAVGRLEEADADFTALGREKLAATLAGRVRASAESVGQLRRTGATGELSAEAEALAAELARLDLVMRWRPSDLARLDSLLDERPELAGERRGPWTALVGEVAVRGLAGNWRLAPRAEDRAVRIAGRVWPVGRALAERLTRGVPLYASLQRARGLEGQRLGGLGETLVIVEAHTHPAAIPDHIARAALTAGVSSLGVFRVRPTPDGAVVLPVSFVDKGGQARVVYIESRPWDPERIHEIRRWLGRLRASAAAASEVSLASAFPPPPLVTDLIAGRAGILPVPGLLDPKPSRRATPQSLNETRLGWIENKADLMERLVRASVAAPDPSDLDLIRKIQQTVATTFRGGESAAAPKQWNALYGYGALYGRILNRALGGQWTGLADDRHPRDWQVRLASGATTCPVGRVLDIATGAAAEDSLMTHFQELKS